MDLALAIPLLLILALPLCFIAVLIKLESPGPALFRQQRRGRRFRPFWMLKFRTMRHGMPDPRPRYETEQRDPRITRLGAILRRTSIDELPQLFNVLAGSMSLVGPRPLVEWESQEALRSHPQRFDVLPGITGLSQVAVRNGAGFSMRLDKDVEYVCRWNVPLDFVILCKTPLRIMRGEDVYPSTNEKARAQ
jgi:lipopolysaccharide/colanic/teichoic acid biosynthesis glycosyltransferase